MIFMKVYSTTVAAEVAYYKIQPSLHGRLCFGKCLIVYLRRGAQAEFSYGWEANATEES